MTAVFIALPVPLAAQLPAVHKFAIAPSPISLVRDVRPEQFVGVEGRKAAWLGKETGEAELWVHPIKLASDFHLDFRIPDYVEPIRGADVARTVEVRPDVTTITYSHATFTVREHILAPRNEPGLLVLLDVTTFRPLEIVASFHTVFQYAWPAGFGGQYAYWDGNQHAFVLSESLARRNAIIGSPWATVASSHPAHALPNAPSTFVIPVDSTRAKTEFIPIVIAAATAPRDTVVASYRRMLARAEDLYHAKRAYVDSLRASTTSLETPDSTLNLAFEWAKVNLDEAEVCNPDLGCGLVAGWGPSGSGERPGFGWFFGGDAAINSFAMSGTGLWGQVARALRFLARYQRKDGKIPHEISQAAAQIPWFTDFPYPYYHLDTTPYWIVAIWRYWRATGDDALVAELWPAIRKAFAWGRTRDTDGDGLIEDGPGNLGAIEVGQLGEGLHEDIYVASVWLESLTAIDALARARGEPQLAAGALRIRERGLRTLNERLWREREGHHAFGILESGETNDNLTVWPATAAAFHLLDATRADRTLTKLATDSITADWGARILSTGSPLYDPMHYNNGAVWPFVTGFVIWGQYNYRRPWSGFPLIAALSQMTFDWSRGRHPELLSGRYYRPLDTAVPQQFFATSMLVSPVVYGLLGFDPDAPGERATLAPQIPAQWDRVAFRKLRIGATSLDVSIQQAPGRQRVTVTRSGPVVTLRLLLAAPAGASHVALTIAGTSVPATIATNPRETTAEIERRLTDSATTFELTWSGGLAVEPSTTDLVPGQTSYGLRVLDLRHIGDATNHEYALTVEGQTGTPYVVRLRGEPVTVADGGVVSGRSGAGTTLSVVLPPGNTPRSTRTLDLKTAP